MPTTIGQISQYQVLMALSSDPTIYTALVSRFVSAEITRGRADEFNGGMQPGTMTLALDNRDGAFSPDNPASPYVGFLVPGRLVQLQARFDTATAWNTLYTGYIDSIRPEDNGPLDSNVIIQCVDWLGKMNVKNITGNVTSGGAGAHDLVNWFASLMGIVDFSAPRTIVNPTDGTSQNLLDFTYTNVTALQALSDFALTVRGVVFAGADGTVRATANGGTATTTLFNSFFVFDQPITNPAANVVGYTALDYDLTTQYLYNDITVTATNTWEGARNAQDAASITAYGKRSLALTFDYMGYNQADVMANTLMLAYRQPKPRVHALTVNVDAATGVVQGGHTAADLLFALELTATVQVTKANPGSLGINRAMVVEGIKHSIKADYGGNGPMHEITLQMSEATVINPTVWILGVSQLGISTVLGYRRPTFDPTTISGLVLLLTADYGVTVSGTNVTQWNDQSGNSNHATCAAAPFPQFTGGGAVSFNGAVMTFAASVLPPTCTVFAVYGAPTGDPAVLLEATGGGHTRALSAPAGFPHYTDDDGTNSVGVFSGVETSLGNKSFIICVSSAAGVPATLYINGFAGLAVTGTGTIIDFATAWTTGGLGDFFFLKALIVYNRVLTDADRQYVINGLNSRYVAF